MEHTIGSHNIPLGQWVEKGRDLIKRVIKYPTIRTGQVIESPPNPYSQQGITWELMHLKERQCSGTDNENPLKHIHCYSFIDHKST